METKVSEKIPNKKGQKAEIEWGPGNKLSHYQNFDKTSNKKGEKSEITLATGNDQSHYQNFNKTSNKKEVKSKIEWTPGNEQSHYQNFSIIREQEPTINSLSQSMYGLPSTDPVNLKGQLHEFAHTNMTQSLSLDRRNSQSIEQSLALINKHVKGLSNINIYGGVPPPPPSEEIVVPPVCPKPDPSLLLMTPPPGFSDSESTSKKSDRRRYSYNHISKPSSLAVQNFKEQYGTQNSFDTTNQPQVCPTDGLPLQPAGTKKRYKKVIN